MRGGRGKRGPRAKWSDRDGPEAVGNGGIPKGNGGIGGCLWGTESPEGNGGLCGSGGFTGLWGTPGASVGVGGSGEAHHAARPLVHHLGQPEAELPHVVLGALGQPPLLLQPPHALGHGADLLHALRTQPHGAPLSLQQPRGAPSPPRAHTRCRLGGSFGGGSPRPGCTVQDSSAATSSGRSGLSTLPSSSSVSSSSWQLSSAATRPGSCTAPPSAT